MKYCYFMKIRLLIIYYCIVYSSLAQDIGFKRLGAEQGLTNSTINAITTDAYGFLWLASREGLIRYDGYQSQFFKNVANDSTSVSDNSILCLKKLSNETLLAGTQFGGLNSFNYKTECFNRYTASKKPSALIHNRVMDIYEDSKNNIWIATWNGLDLFHPETGTFEHILLPDPNHAYTDKNFVSSITEDKDGNLWLFCQGNRIGFLQQGLKEIKIVATIGSIDKVKSTGTVLVDSRNQLWIGGYIGVYCYKIQTNKLTNIPGKYNEIKGTYIREIIEDHNKTIWIGSDGNGLYSITNKGQLNNYKYNPFDPNSISSNAIISLFESEANSLWVGTYASGLNVLHKNTPNFISFSDQGVSNKRLSNKSVLSFQQISDTEILLGTDGGGINLFNPNESVITPWPYSNQLQSGVIKCMHQDRQQNVWIGTFKGGLSVFNQQTQTVKNYERIANPNGSSIRHNNVWSITEDHDGNIWIGLLGEGIDVWKKNENKFIYYPAGLNEPSGLTDGIINYLYTDHLGNIWIGTERGGLYLYLSESNSFRNFSFSINDPTSISGNNIKVIFQDSKNTIWIGTENNGLNKLIDIKQGKFNRINNKEIPSSIYAIEEDQEGTIWLSSNNGLIAYNANKNEAIRFDKNDNLQSNLFASGASFKDKSLNMYFGGPSGFSYLPSNSIQIEKTNSQVYIHNIKLFNESIHKGNTKEDILHVPSYLTKTITIQYADSKVIGFDFSTTDFKNPSKRIYRYLLEGFDKDWLITDANKRSATYTNLQPGTYTFHVQVSNGTDGWSTKEASIELTILPPWWMTWWFRTVAIIGITTSIFLGFYIRIQRIKKRNIELTQEVEFRTKELKKANELLNEINLEVVDKNIRLEKNNFSIKEQHEKILIQQNEIILQKNELEKSNKTKDKLFSLVSHDLRNPANALNSLSEFLSKTDNLSENDRNEIITRIGSSSKALSHLVNNLLDWARAQVSGMNPILKHVQLNSLVENTLTLLQSQASNKQISLRYTTDYDYIVDADETMMASILRNIIGNAIKFTSFNGAIDILISESTENHFTISIKDSGVGMSEEQLADLFDFQKYSYTNGTNNEVGSGLGMSITYEFVKLNKGNIYVSSTLNVGTEILVRFPYISKTEIIIEEEESIYTHFPLEIIELEKEYTSVKGKKILLVEDDQTTREILKHTFSNIFEIYEAQDGKTAYYQAITHQPEIIISDIRMPGGDGFELCHKLKNNPETSHIAIFLITTDDNQETEIKAFKAGADDYFAKPITKELVMVKITSYFENLEKKIRQFSGVEWNNSEELTNNTIDQDLLEKIIQYIEENISDSELNADKICKEISVSRAVLYKKLKSISGQSVNEFIRIIRLKQSIILLKQRKLNISEIAYDVGFNSLSYFTRSFTKQFGVSPSDYLKNNTEY